jgi:hypothetical protein
MEVIDLKRTFDEVDGKLKFYRNTLILQNEDAYFYAYTYERFQKWDEIRIDELDILRIPKEDIYPPFSPTFALAPDPLPLNCFIKGPDLLGYRPNAPVGKRPSDILSREISICEALKEHPHINIAQYLGCRVKDDRVTGLVFVKYSTTLAERFEEKGRPLRPEIYLKGLENGIRHLHDLGLIHNDINPHNVMLREDDTPVIIDFNTVQREGEGCSSGGTTGWNYEKMEFAVRENDYYGLERIRKALEMGKMPGHEEPWE